MLILVLKPRTVRNVNLIPVLANHPMERRHGKKFKFMLEENPRELFQGKPTQSSQEGNENPINKMSPTGFEPGFQIVMGSLDWDSQERGNDYLTFWELFWSCSSPSNTLVHEMHYKLWVVNRGRYIRWVVYSQHLLSFLNQDIWVLLDTRQKVYCKASRQWPVGNKSITCDFVVCVSKRILTLNSI